ncbi:MAG TPA: hypothetical protein VK464_01595 [Symbiobacteriaceae bacterium]|jgi:peroxiredoxin|nr:hypothetical protein [Symbiobacteriaceae bacterium]
MTLPVGAAAPAFDLPATRGGTIARDGLLGQPFLLSFYSMAFTPV